MTLPIGEGLNSFRAGRLALPSACVCLLFVAMVATACRKAKPPPPTPPEVQVITAAATNEPIFEEWIGTLDGYVNAEIRAQVPGYLLTQNYTEGSEVKKGDLLFQVDPRPFEAALQQTEAKLAQDQSQVERTRLDLLRYRPLAASNAVSRQELDNAEQANIAAIAQIKLDQAATENAKLNLGFTKIASPIDGLAGVAQVQIGDLVGPTSGVLTTVSTVDPIKVQFQVNEQWYLQHSGVFATNSQNSAQEALQLELILSDGSTYPHKGRFYFADRQVNAGTGTLRIFGLFPNPDLRLRPGQYARVRAQTHLRQNVIVVPQRAVTELQGSYEVAVVGDDNRAHIRAIKMGEQVGSGWIIEEGAKPGERVVVEGLQKVKEGTIVNPKPFAPEVQPPDAGPRAW